MSHITGGGLAANLARVVPDDVSVRVDRSTWTRPRCSRSSPTSAVWRRPTWSRPSTSASAWLRSSTESSADDAVRLLGEHGVDAWIAGDVAAAGVHGPGGSVTLTGDHA